VGAQIETQLNWATQAVAMDRYVFWLSTHMREFDSWLVKPGAEDILTEPS